MSFAVVTPDCAPTVSFRGSVLTDGDDALVVWFRNLESATAAGLAEHDQVVLTWFGGSQQAFLQFGGRAERDAAAGAGSRPRQEGFAGRVQLDTVGGRLGGEMPMMTS